MPEPSHFQTTLRRRLCLPERPAKAKAGHRPPVLAEVAAAAGVRFVRSLRAAVPPSDHAEKVFRILEDDLALILERVVVEFRGAAPKPANLPEAPPQQPPADQPQDIIPGLTAGQTKDLREFRRVSPWAR